MWQQTVLQYVLHLIDGNGILYIMSKCEEAKAGRLKRTHIFSMKGKSHHKLF